MLIRKIEPPDAENFLAMLRQLDTETDMMMYEPGERKTTVAEMTATIADLNDEQGLILVAEDDGAIVGFLSAERGFAVRIRHSAYIVVGILRAYRGRKIGRKLFEALAAWAEGQAITRLELTVMANNAAAIALYEKMGFAKEGLKRNSLRVAGQYVDEFYMARLL